VIVLFLLSLEYLFFRRVVPGGLNLLSESPCGAHEPGAAFAGLRNSLKRYPKSMLPAAMYYGQPGNYQHCAYTSLGLYLKRY
jgi:hypothetical protein